MKAFLGFLSRNAEREFRNPCVGYGADPVRVFLETEGAASGLRYVPPKRGEQWGCFFRGSEPLGGRLPEWAAKVEEACRSFTEEKELPYDGSEPFGRLAYIAALPGRITGAELLRRLATLAN